MDEIADRVSKVKGFPIEKVMMAAGKNRKTVQARGVLCYWDVRECGMTLVELAKRFEISSTAVSQSVARGQPIVLKKNLDLIER